jgi:hypothetical protein
VCTSIWAAPGGPLGRSAVPKRWASSGAVGSASRVVFWTTTKFSNCSI